jgi:hypothetical protein
MRLGLRVKVVALAPESASLLVHFQTAELIVSPSGAATRA